MSGGPSSVIPPSATPSSVIPAPPEAPPGPPARKRGAAPRAGGGSGHGRRPWMRWVPPLFAVAVTALALTTLRHELHAYRYHDIVRGVKSLPPARVLAALALTAVGYAVLFCYDALSLRYIGRRLPVRRMALASFIAYAFSQTLGYASLTGASVRYRFWSSWGLSAPEIAQGVAFSALTFWLGVLTIAGATLAFHPAGTAFPGSPPEWVLRPLGGALLSVVAGYLVWNALARRPIAVRGWRFRVPGPGLAAAQLVTSALDWGVASAVLWALLPPAPGLSFTAWLGIFLLAQTAGLVSHVPGGVGVFETVVVLLLEPYLPAARVLGALLAYRAIYYLLPFGTATVSLGAYELLHRRDQISRMARVAGRWVSPVAPYVLSAATFLAGCILLFSGATPALRHRLAWLDALLPLGVIELSHFVASVAGVWLLVLALGLRRRLDGAYHLTVVVLAVGIVASLLKGGDYEEAAALALVLAVLLPSQQLFYRRAALTSEPWSPGWIAAVALVLGGTLWLGLFSYKHVRFSSELWWHFTLHGDAPRFLRAMVGAVITVVAFSLMRLLRPAATLRAPTPEEIERAAAIADEWGAVDAHLAALGDKALLFGEHGGLLMYAISGRSWIALGDPIGPPAERAELAWRFKELADEHDGWPVFYEVGADGLPLYIDLGLTLLKLGEEARVPLESWSLEGGARKGMRRTVREIEKEGATFAILQPEEVADVLPELRQVSDAWLEAKHTREKGFSLGFFDERYLRRFPVAVVRVYGRIVAFANVWQSAAREELSVDLMRYVPDAPHGVMDYMFIELMLWGKREGYRWFNLGMAPLSGFERRALAPLWSRVGAMVFRHGEHFYNFRGLRQYKEKFDPVWTPSYLASPGGLALPRILANVASLISGGLTGVVAR
ncbi:MAG TPA: bifunctional lysylphosphatidylglycerol flippase/synthetase MprF [Gemmatimonadaceae bacterium]|nr:bifunctional lysylphosphatidylglycerol flippase/synthetase MprF [Gemmatimonadaceae bacterium]